MSEKVAVVTGSNKGLGFAIVKRMCKKYNGIVYLTSRDIDKGKAAVKELREQNLRPEYHQLDVTDRESVKRFRDHIKEKHGGLDILINNAGIATTLFSSYEEDKIVIDTNYKSIFIAEEFLYPLVRKNGRILNISSNCGHLSNLRNKYWIERLSGEDLSVADVNEFVEWYLDSVKNGNFKKENIADWGTIPAYRVAKMALSAVTMLQQKTLEDRNISINCIHPGVIRTSMTLGSGFLTADEAAETPIKVVLDAPQSLKGCYLWYDGTVVDWYDYKSNHYFKIWSLMAWAPWSWSHIVISHCANSFSYEHYFCFLLIVVFLYYSCNFLNNVYFERGIANVFSFSRKINCSD